MESTNTPPPRQAPMEGQDEQRMGQAAEVVTQPSDFAGPGKEDEDGPVRGQGVP